MVGPHPPHSLATSSSSNSSSPKLAKKNGLTKTKSLERHFDCRIDKATTALAREQARLFYKTLLSTIFNFMFNLKENTLVGKESPTFSNIGFCVQVIT